MGTLTIEDLNPESKVKYTKIGEHTVTLKTNYVYMKSKGGNKLNLKELF